MTAPSSSIPWKSGPTAAALLGDGAADNRFLHDLANTFHTDPTQQLAYRTIVSEVLRSPLLWHGPAASVGDESVPVPDWWINFVGDAVRSILLTGYFVYRHVGSRAGVPVCVVADPCVVTVHWCTKKNDYYTSCTKHKWWLGMVEAPNKVHCTIGGHERRLNSAASRAANATRHLNTLMKNWVARDSLNSSPGVFTSVSDELKQQNGSDRQWFRNVGADTMNTRAQDIDVNFHTLVHRRAETVAKLDELTNMSRQRQSTGELTHVGETKTLMPPPLTHQEHIVSDGRVFTERRPLNSQSDSQLLLDELKHTVLFAFGVPPQALGKNINSERMASSNRLTEMAINTYVSFIKLLRTRIGEEIRRQTTTPSASYIDFSVCLTQYELENVQPLLKTDIALHMISRTFDVPVHFLDQSRVRSAQLAAFNDHPSVRPDKRPRTDEESTAVLRKKAAEPA